MSKRLSDEWREMAKEWRGDSGRGGCMRDLAMATVAEAAAVDYDQRHPPGGEPDHRELLLRAATALRAVVHSSVGSRELLDLAEQLEHAMGDPEPRG